MHSERPSCLDTQVVTAWAITWVEPVVCPEAYPKLAVDSGTCWEEIAGFSRAVRTGNRVCVSGTTATDANGNVVGGSDPAAQVCCLAA